MNKIALLTLTLLILPLVVSPAWAEEPGPSIEDLAFFAGSWHGELFGGKADETWMAPRDGTMIGVFRLTWDDGRKLYELLIIEEVEGEVKMVFRHFGAGMELWEREIERPNRFALVEQGENFAVFDAPDRSQEPARFRFERDPETDKLTVTVTSLDDEGQVKESFDAVYERRQ